MNSHEQQPISEPLRSTAIPIAQISPDADLILERSIHAIVTLVWPYSSSNKSLSLLLAEPDFRLRRNNGQVKVVFRGRAAESVAKSQVGIGDHVYLGLAGSKFVLSEAVAQTPGKCVPWDVQLDDRVLLEIWRSSLHFSTVKLDPSPVPTQNAEDAIAPPATPIANGRVERSKATSAATLEAWRSPAFVERTRTSFGGLVDSAYDPFAEEDGFVPGKGRKRPRFSFRGADWRVIDEPASPGEKEEPADWTWMFEEDGTHESDVGGEDHTDSATLPQEISTATATVPNAPEGADTVANVGHESLDVGLMSTERMAEQPTRPSPGFAHPLSAPGFPQHFARQQFPGSDFQYPTDTPRLYPIPSPGLPIPSPLVTRSSSAHDYFPPVASNVQTSLDQSAAEGKEVKMTDEEKIVISSVQPDVPTMQEVQPLVTTPQQAAARDKSGLVFQKASIDLEAEGQRGMKDTSAADAMPFEDRDPARHHEDVEKRISNVPPVSLDQSYAEKPAEIASRDIRDVAEEESEQSGIDQEMGEVQDEENNEGSEDELEEQSEVELEEESFEEESAEEEEDELVEEYGYEDVEIQEHGKQRPPDSFGVNDFHQDGTRRYEDSEVEEIAIGANGALEDDDGSGTRSEPFSAAERRAAEERVHPHNFEEESGEDVHEGGYEDEGTFDEEDIEGRDERVEVLEEEEEEEDDDDEEESEPEDEQEAYEDYYDDRVESESESYAGADSAARSEKVVHPEVIVLDSDSEDEAVVSAPTQTRTPSAEYAAEGNYVESSATSAEEDEVYDRSSDGSEAEVWPEDELAEDDQTRDDEAEDESTQDELAARDNAEDELMEDAPSEEDSAAEERMEDQADAKKYSALPDPVQSEVQQEADVENEFISDTRNEVLQATSGIPQSPEGQDIADLRVSVAQSTQGPYTDSESGPRGQDLAIDPELYRLGRTGENERHSPQGDAHAEPGPEKPRLEDERTMEPLSDGAASPQPVDSSAELASLVQEPSPQAPLLVTPDASQLTAPSHHLPSRIPIGDFLPTPEQTQEVAQGLSTQYDGNADALAQTVLQISTTSVETDVSSANESNVRMSSTLAEEQRQTQTDGVSVHDEEYAMSSVGDEIPSEVHDWRVSAQSLERMPSVINRHHPGLRSKYSYFAPLATLIDYYNSLLDTISVVSEVSPISRATTGKKDFTLTLQVTDPSMAGTIVHAQIFRPYKFALPSVKEGDAILLRNFQVKSFNHSMMLVSADTSAWAVFNNASKEAQAAGPPIEYGDEESAYATDLRQWYHEVGIAMVADYQLQASVQMASREATPVSSVAHSDAGSVDSASREVRGESSVSNRGSKRRKSHRRITIHELRDGRRYAEVGSPSDKESIHELRDGTVYANL
ncbi:dynein heavy chain-like protein PF11_0240 [Aspergillus udagawae]|nr:dynein heavy chain-like protein PF11_0240 [Aspergillus udagawae]